MSASRRAAPPDSAVSHAFLAHFASQLRLPPSTPPSHPSAIGQSPASRRKPRRRLRPIPLTPESSDTTDAPRKLEPRTAAFTQSAEATLVTRESGSDAPVHAAERHESKPSEALRAGVAQNDGSFLRALQGVSKGVEEQSCDNAEGEGGQEQRVEWSDALQQHAIVHASHIRAIVDESALFLEALQSLHQLAYTSSSEGARQDASSSIHNASSAIRSRYCQAVLSQLHSIVRTFPIPIQRALNHSTNESQFPRPATRAWLPPHPPHISFRLLQEESNDVKPISHRLNTNLEIAWDSLLDMLRTYCGHKKEPAGTFSEQKLLSLTSSLHPCNTDIFAARFVNLISTYTINAQQPTHIRLLDQRLHASSSSSHASASNQTGVTLHRVPQCVLVEFDDIPAHKFFARFLTSIDSARFNTALLPRFLARVLLALKNVSTVASNHEFCDAVLEARLYARFLAVVMHTVNWSHSPFAISGSSSQSKGSGNEKVSHADKPRLENSQDRNNKEQAKQRPQDDIEGTSGDKSKTSKKEHEHVSQTLRSGETPGLGSHALLWRVWHFSPLWQNVFNVNELLISAVSSKQVTAVVAAAAVADVLLRFSAVDPVAKSSPWFHNGLSAMKKLCVIDQSDGLRMPLVQFLKTDLLTCDQIDANDADWQGNGPFDERYVLRCDACEWSAIGNMRLLQECCTSLARFRKTLAESSDSRVRKTASRRITPRMTGSTDSASPLHDRAVPEANGTLRHEEHEEGDDQDRQERFRREFLSRLDSRLLELMQIVMSSRPESEEDARKKYLRVAKTLYSDIPVTVRAVAAHICGRQVELRLQSNANRTTKNAKK